MSQTLANSVFIKSESYNLKSEESGVTVEGLALPFGKVSRNGVLYTKESVLKTYKGLEGKPMLFNHNPNRVVGHISKVWVDEEGLHYNADLDPEEKDIIRKVERGDIKNVSIQVIYENPTMREDNSLQVDVKEFLELSIVTLPGFADTTAKIVEALNTQKEEYDKRYQNPDGSFKKMTDPKNPDSEPSKFNGCVRYMMAQGKSYDSAQKICAYIKMKKKSSFNFEDLAEFHALLSENNNEKVVNLEKDKKEEVKKEQEAPADNTAPKEEPQDNDKDIVQLIQELEQRVSQLEAKISKMENPKEEKEEEPVKKPEEKPKETPEEKKGEERLSVEVPVKEENIDSIIKTSELLSLIKQ